MRKTISEILFQPEAWTKTLRSVLSQKHVILAFLEKHQEAEIILTGCGTSYYLPLTAAPLYTKLTGKPARGVPASEIMLYPDTIFASGKKYLLVSFSRSGITPETLAATKYLRDSQKGEALLITCTADSVLAGQSDLVVYCPEAAEETKYMTKSFSSMLIAFQLITAFQSRNQQFEAELLQLPKIGAALISRYQSKLEQMAKEQDFNLYIYLGHGPLYGIAEEAMLKIKEMACIPAEAYHGMEFMHGPKYAVDYHTLIMYLLSDRVQDQEIQLLKRIKDWGGKVRIICEERSPGVSAIDCDAFDLQSGLSEDARPGLVILLNQLYGYYRALALGQDLD